MTLVLIVAICVLAVALLAVYLHLNSLSQQVQALQQARRSTPALLDETAQRIEHDLKASLHRQEELIAALWYSAFGLDKETEEDHSGKLTEYLWLRPQARVRDPWFIDDCPPFFRRSRE